MDANSEPPRPTSRTIRKTLTKRRRRRFLRRLRAMLASALALGIVGLLYLMWTGPFWQWKGQMAVSGNRLVSRTDIMAKLFVPQNTPLYQLNPQWIAAQLRAIPAIRLVAVRRWLFPARLEITVLERQGLVQIEGPPGEPDPRSVLWVDEEGVIFAAPRSQMMPRFPIKVVTTLHLGDRLPTSVQAHLVEILNAWPAPRVGRLDLRDPHDIYARVGTWPVRLGEAADVGLKFGMFEALQPLAQKYKDRLKYINVRFPGSPTFVLKSGDEINMDKNPLPAPSPTPSVGESPAASSASPRPSTSPRPSLSPRPGPSRSP